MDWLCFRKREILITDSEERTGNKIRRYMQCLLTRISNKKNLIPTDYTESQQWWGSPNPEEKKSENFQTGIPTLQDCLA